MNNLNSFSPKNCPNQRSSATYRTNALINLSQPSVISLIRLKHRVWTYNLPRFCEASKMAGEIYFLLLIFKTLLCSNQSFPSTDSPVNSGEETNTVAHIYRYEAFNLIKILDNTFDCLFIESKRLGDIVEYPNKVNDKS